MSSTDDPALEGAQELFTALCDAAAALAARGVRFHPVIDDATSSYWEAHSGALVREDDGAPFAALSARWASEGLDELSPIADGLAKLDAQTPRGGDVWEDVSPYIYAMF